MPKKYTPVPDEKRHALIRRIYEDGMTITQAAKMSGVAYPIAKVINKVYQTEGRISKKLTRKKRRCPM